MAEEPTFTRTEDGLWVDENGEIFEFPEAEEGQLAWFVHQFHGAAEHEKNWKNHKARMGLGIKELTDEKYVTAGDIRASIITSTYTVLDKNAIWEGLMTEVVYIVHEEACGCGYDYASPECPMTPLVTLAADLLSASKGFDLKQLGDDIVPLFKVGQTTKARKSYVKTTRARTDAPDYSVGQREGNKDGSAG